MPYDSSLRACELLLAILAPLAGDPPCPVPEGAQLLPNDGAQGDRSGSALALDGDTAIVGSTLHDHPAAQAGSAYVFVRSGGDWQQQAELSPSDVAAGDRCGTAVGSSGERAIVASPRHDAVGSDSGAAYVFVRSGTTWTEEAELVPNDAAAGDWFGFAVGLSEDTAAVGAVQDQDQGLFSGSVYVFVRNGTSWSPEQKLVAEDGAPWQRFGCAVAVDGDTLLVGACGDAEHGFESGAAYVFVRSGGIWSQQARLVAIDGAAGHLFGSSVALSGESALVGAPHADGAASESGRAYLFVRVGSNWILQARLDADAGDALDEFGSAVALDGDRAIVGARYDAELGVQAGAAYGFARQGGRWIRQAKLVASTGAAGDRFGSAAAVSGSTALVGAPLDDDAAPDLGSVFAFELAPPSGTIYCTCTSGPCGNSEADAGCTNSTGRGAQLVAFGTTSPDAVDLYVTGARPGQAGIVFQGNNAVTSPFGDGLRCAGGGVLRVTVPALHADAEGTAVFGPCFGDPTISSITGVVPGSGATKRYQFWYRDPGGPCASGFNLSNGYELIW